MAAFEVSSDCRGCQIEEGKEDEKHCNHLLCNFFVRSSPIKLCPKSWETGRWQTVSWENCEDFLGKDVSWSQPVHYVHFVKYDDTVSFYDAVSDTIRRRGGDRGIFTEEGVDTVAYFGGNHGSRVWKSLKLKKVYFPRTRTSWDKYMFNRIVFLKI